MLVCEVRGLFLSRSRQPFRVGFPLETPFRAAIEAGFMSSAGAKISKKTPSQ